MIGLERGKVKLVEHDPYWFVLADEHVRKIKNALGEIAIDIAHVGSTAIPGLCAKPIIDIVVGVKNFHDSIVRGMEHAGYLYRPAHDSQTHMLFIDADGEIRRAHIHVVQHMSMEWRNYLNFRDYLKAFPQVKRTYRDLKNTLAKKYPNDREQYTLKKAEFITYTLRKAMVWSFLGQYVCAQVDRPVGYLHRKGEKELLYPINYGFIPGVLGGDGEELDVYYLGTDKPLTSFSGRVIAIVHRKDDSEDKLVVAADDYQYTAEQICREIYFQEKYYDTTVELINGQKLHISNGVTK